MGIFHPYIARRGVRLIGVEAAGEGIDTGKHCRLAAAGRARRAARQPHLPAAGRGRPDHRDPLDLRRPGLPRRRPRARLAEGHRPRRVRRPSPTRKRCEAFHNLCRLEGIIPALESSHALAYAAEAGADPGQGQDPAGQPLRPGRQGHAPWPKSRGSSSEVAHSKSFRTPERRGPQGADSLHHGRRPGCGADRAVDALVWSRPGPM